VDPGTPHKRFEMSTEEIKPQITTEPAEPTDVALDVPKADEPQQQKARRRSSIQPTVAAALHSSSPAEAVAVAAPAPCPTKILEMEKGPISAHKKEKKKDNLIKAYFKRWLGVKGRHGPRGPHWYNWVFPQPVLDKPIELLASFIGAFLGMIAVGALHYQETSELQLALVMGSFGATAVLLYGAPASPLAQPRNVILGHVLSAIIGVSIRKAIVEEACGGAANNLPCFWSSAAFAVALAIVIMELCGCLHPPGGATALIAVTATGWLQEKGYLFVIFPAFIGASIMLFVALVVNNCFPRTRRYPQYWW
jgi:uncharacterized membrane protein YeaQ/YmgE (transglycosylase-associated protein family)